MINLSRVSKLLYCLISDERWLIKGKGDSDERRIIKGVDNCCYFLAEKDGHYLLGTEKLHGKLKSYNSDGRINSDRFIKNQLEGISKCLYQNGNLRWKVMYKQGNAIGEIKGWYENGTISYHYYCNLGLKVGMKMGIQK